MDKIKSQKQLNIQTEDRWDASCIHVDVPSLQKEDYQLQMLQNNRIRGLLELSVTGREESSRYTYKTFEWCIIGRTISDGGDGKKGNPGINGAVTFTWRKSERVSS